MLSMQSRYALRALLHLAKAGTGKPLSTAAIADAACVPRKFLEAILVSLKRNNVVTSKLGKGGGYVLARPADQISFAEVIRVTDGPISLLPCVSKHFYRRCDDCVDENLCELRRVMIDARDQILAVLEHRSLADAISGIPMSPDVAAQICPSLAPSPQAPPDPVGRSSPALAPPE